MRRSRATEGSTLIVVVLFTLMLLAGLLAASLRLGVSSRRAVVDSGQALAAQYAAESAVARAAVRVGEIQRLLTGTQLAAPTGLTSATLLTYAQQYCGNAVWTTGTSPTNGASVLSCTVTPTLDMNQFQVLSALVQSSAYANVLPSGEANGAGTPQWWKGQLGTTLTVGGGDVGFRYQIQPLRVEREGTSTFRFYLRLVSVSAMGTRGGATRVLMAEGVQNGVWYIKASRPGFLNNVLMTNHHRSRGTTAAVPNVNFTTQNFNGPVHTNEKFLFSTGSTASFGGQVTSAGCTNIDALAVGATACTQTPGVHVGGTALSPAAGLSGDNMNANLQGQIAARASVNWNINPPQVRGPQFDAAYKPMPTVAGNVRTDAIANGLYLPATMNPRNIVLRAGDANGNAPTSYNTTTQKWSPAPTHQFITVTPAVGAAIVLRYGADRTLQQQVNGSWVNVTSNFNGVVFSENVIGFNDSNNGNRKAGGLSGPGRDGSGRPLPAVAPFAGLTVAGQRDMHISGDLTMSETPLICNPAAPNYASCTADANSRQNVLGLYVQGTNTAPADISVTQEAPNNLTIQAMTMTSTGEMNVQGHNQGTPRGNINLTGGLVENWYGAFGTVNNNTPSTGYGRNFNYDWRFLNNPGFGPPSYPISPAWVFEDAQNDGDLAVTAATAPLNTTLWRQASVEDY